MLAFFASSVALLGTDLGVGGPQQLPHPNDFGVTVDFKRLHQGGYAATVLSENRSRATFEAQSDIARFRHAIARESILMFAALRTWERRNFGIDIQVSQRVQGHAAILPAKTLQRNGPLVPAHAGRKEEWAI